jgi:hypothetical protein
MRPGERQEEFPWPGMDNGGGADGSVNFLAEYLLKASRHYYRKIMKPEDPFGLVPVCPENFDFFGQEASDFLKGKILAGVPLMVARLGAVELNCMLTYHSIRQDLPRREKCLRFIKGRIKPFWWEKKIVTAMSNNAGFFPPTESMLSRFYERMVSDLGWTDVLGSWMLGESVFRGYSPAANTVPLYDLEPYRHRDPWSEALGGKTVLVVHPFEETIRKQYGRRKFLFPDRRVLPDFELKTLKAVQSAAGCEVPFPDWFRALEFMAERMECIRFDIALIGCGAYGFPLAAFAKQLGRQAIHLGGALQLLFGIKGKRWDQANLYNEQWVRPARDETPSNSGRIESGCYW